MRPNSGAATLVTTLARRGVETVLVTGGCGLIGSATKWARFRSRLKALGHDPAEIARITCPIGIQGITGKEPEVIAISVAAQLLQTPG